MNSDIEMSCPFQPSHVRSSSGSSSTGTSTVQDKKQYEKQPTRHRIGNAFRNSWGRKDAEHKGSKKNSSLVMNILLFNAAFIKVMQNTLIRNLIRNNAFKSVIL